MSLTIDMPGVTGVGGIGGSDSGFFRDFGREALGRAGGRLLDEVGLGPDQPSILQGGGGFDVDDLTNKGISGDVQIGVPDAQDLVEDPMQSGGPPQQTGFIDIQGGNFSMVVLAVLGFFVIREVID